MPFEDVWRREAPHVLAALLRRSGDLAACEDAVQLALLAAAEQWPREGLPEEPRAWLRTVATRRLVDAVRSDASRRAREERAFRLEEPLHGADGPERRASARTCWACSCCARIRR